MDFAFHQLCPRHSGTLTPTAPTAIRLWETFTFYFDNTFSGSLVLFMWFSRSIGLKKRDGFRLLGLEPTTKNSQSTKPGTLLLFCLGTKSAYTVKSRCLEQ